MHLNQSVFLVQFFKNLYLSNQNFILIFFNFLNYFISYYSYNMLINNHSFILYYLKLVNYFYSFRLDTHIHLDFLYLPICNQNHFGTLLYKKCFLLYFESHQFIMGYLIMADLSYLVTKLFVVFETFIILFTNNVQFKFSILILYCKVI